MCSSMKRTKAVAVSGVKNSGKTTLVEKLVACLTAKGLKVAVVKHDGHRFEADRPDTDTFRHLAAGAMGTAVFDGEKFQVVKYAPVEEEALMALFPEADLILLEGFKHSRWPKIEVVREGISDQSVCDPDTLLAVASDLPLSLPGVPLFGLEDVEGLSHVILDHCFGGERS